MTNGKYPDENLEQYIPETKYSTMNRKQLTALKTFVRNLNDGSKTQEAMRRTMEELQDYGYTRHAISDAVRPYLKANNISWFDGVSSKTGKVQQSVLNVAREFYREPSMTWEELKTKLGVE